MNDKTIKIIAGLFMIAIWGIFILILPIYSIVMPIYNNCLYSATILLILASLNLSYIIFNE